MSTYATYNLEPAHAKSHTLKQPMTRLGRIMYLLEIISEEKLREGKVGWGLFLGEVVGDLYKNNMQEKIR